MHDRDGGRGQGGRPDLLISMDVYPPINE